MKKCARFIGLVLIQPALAVLVLWISISGSLLAEPKPLLVEGVIGKMTFKLINDKSQCQLSLHSSAKIIKIIPLESQSPCYFFADSEQKNIQLYAYPEQQIDAVILIGGTAIGLTDDIRQRKKLPVDSYCTQYIQAVILEKGIAKISTVNINAIACAEDRIDEKMYRQALRQAKYDSELLVKSDKKPEGETPKPLTSDMSFIESIVQKVGAIFKEEKLDAPSN